jgi:hypothetical protein
MALVSDTFETRERALKICEPSCIGRHATPSFIHEAHGPLETAGRVEAPEPFSTGKRGPKP